MCTQGYILMFEKWKIIGRGENKEHEEEEEVEKVVGAFLPGCVSGLQACFPIPSAFRQLLATEV